MMISGPKEVVQCMEEQKGENHPQLVAGSRLQIRRLRQFFRFLDKSWQRATKGAVFLRAGKVGNSIDSSTADRPL